MHRQKGFSLVEGLLIVLVITAIGIGGYYVWSQQDDEERSQIIQQEPQNNQKEEQPIEEVPTVPEEWVEYKNEELGISFIYPEEWGQVQVSEFDGLDRTDYFEFSKIEYFGLGGHQKDYETPDRGGSLIDYGGFNEVGGEIFFRNYTDGSTDSTISTSGYALNENKTCIYTTELIFFASPAYHATCNLTKVNNLAFNFGVYDSVRDDAEPPVEEADFVRVINSVEVE